MVDFVYPASTTNLFGGSWNVLSSLAKGGRSMGALDSSFSLGDPGAWTGRKPTPTLFSKIPNIRLTGSVPVELRSPSEIRFSRGLWEGALQFGGVGSSVRLSVRDVLGYTGASDPFALAAPIDSDGDGLPDAWEKLAGLDMANQSDAKLDSDGDGLSNDEEYQAGTNPNDVRDVLRIYSVEMDGGAVAISVLVVPGHSYVVERTTTIGQPWSEFSRIDNAETDLYRLADPMTATSGAFYRVRLAP
jgi:hypothetical protein